MTRTIAIVLALAGCAVDAEPTPVVTYRIETVDPEDPDLEHYHSGAEVWRELGIAEDPAGRPLWIRRFRGLAAIVGSNGVADRNARVITIETDVSAFQLAVLVAHEVGHIVLDTGEHTTCGIMGGADVLLCDEDRELACRVAGLCN